MRIGILLFLFASPVFADDWPQFRGQNRDGSSKETGLLKEWSKAGPKLLWTFNQAGLGYSGPAVVAGKLYIAGGRGDEDTAFALDISGKEPKELWSAKIGPIFQWKANEWNKGPNATPTVGDGLVYALGGFGDLVCFEAATGKEIWRKNLPKDFGGEVNPIGGGLDQPTPLGWGYAPAPLIDGDNLICVPGGPKGLFASLNRKTGDLAWRSAEVVDQAPYASPLVVEVDGAKQYISAVNSGIVGVSAKDGKKLWSYQRPQPYDDVVIATPIYHDKHVYTTVGFQQGCDLVKLTANGAEKVFSNKNVENRDGGVVLVDGHLYGHSENKGWFCQEFKTGKIVWSERERLGRGSIAYADGRLYCVAEKGGTVVLLEATPTEYSEKGRFKLPAESKNRRPSGGLWTHPVIAEGKLYIRDQELLFCFDLKN